MDELPDLAELSVIEKDALIRTLFARVQDVQVLAAQVQVLTAKGGGTGRQTGAEQP
jgi:hypothetical protein